MHPDGAGEAIVCDTGMQGKQAQVLSLKCFHRLTSSGGGQRIKAYPSTNVQQNLQEESHVKACPTSSPKIA